MRKDLIIAILGTFCLTVTLFTVIPIRSQTTEPYDPWEDLNDDGKIDIYDAVLLLNSYGTTGSPVNKTALLYNVNETFTELLLKIDSLNASLIDLEALLAEQQTKILELETKLAILNATKLGKPDYDSFKDPEVGGWQYLAPDDPWRFDHHLGTTNVIVYLMFSNDINGSNINHHWYGGQNSGTWWGGAWWSNLTEDFILVERYAHSDECAYVRVMIWKIPE